MSYPPLVPQKQPNLWTCYPVAVSMLTGVPLTELMHDIGHDGSREGCHEGEWHRESFTTTEMALALLGLGWALVPLNSGEANSRGGHRTGSPRLPEVMRVAAREGLRAVVVVQRPGRQHCLAWDAGAGLVIDPRTGGAVEPDGDDPFREPVLAVELLIPLE
jgi:hypothetical protein